MLGLGVAQPSGRVGAGRGVGAERQRERGREQGARDVQGRGVTVCTSDSGSSTLSGVEAMYACANFAPICQPQ